MSSTMLTLAPTATVGSLVLFCCWPGGDASPAADSDSRAAGSRVQATSRVQPGPEKTSARDPFGLSAHAGVKSTNGSSQQAEKSDKDKTASAASAAGNATKPAAKREGLTLGGVFMRGERRLALINDRFYAEGDPLKDRNGLKGTLLLERVEAERVVLKDGDEKLELRFRGIEPATTKSPAAKKPPPPPTRRKPS